MLLTAVRQHIQHCSDDFLFSFEREWQQVKPHWLLNSRHVIGCKAALAFLEMLACMFVSAFGGQQSRKTLTVRHPVLTLHYHNTTLQRFNKSNTHTHLHTPSHTDTLKQVNRFRAKPAHSAFKDQDFPVGWLIPTPDRSETGRGKPNHGCLREVLLSCSGFSLLQFARIVSLNMWTTKPILTSTVN